MTEERLIFMLSSDDDGNLVLMIGVTEPAFDFMKKTGKTHTLDLRREGAPLKVMVFGGHKTRDEAMQPILDYAEAAGIPIERKRADYSIKTKDRRH